MATEGLLPKMGPDRRKVLKQFLVRNVLPCRNLQTSRLHCGVPSSEIAQRRCRSELPILIVFQARHCCAAALLRNSANVIQYFLRSNAAPTQPDLKVAHARSIAQPLRVVTHMQAAAGRAGVTVTGLR